MTEVRAMMILKEDMSLFPDNGYFEAYGKYTANKFAVLDREMCLSKP